MSTSWIIVTDFDGTLTEKDVGNELCEEVVPQKFKELHKLYKSGSLNFKNFQQQMWTHFPTSEAEFKRLAVKHGKLRRGCEVFLSACHERRLPLYVASCGLRPYIEEVLKKNLSPELYALVKEIRCNEVSFGTSRIETFETPEKSDDAQVSFDKGKWCEELRVKHPRSKILGIGNGTSDRSFAGKIDVFATTEALTLWCQKNSIAHTHFETLDELLSLAPFRGTV